MCCLALTRFLGEISTMRFLSSAPVVATVWFTITAGILIEANRFFPDLLAFPF
jgi:photosystem I subunit 9